MYEIVFIEIYYTGNSKNTVWKNVQNESEKILKRTRVANEKKKKKNRRPRELRRQRFELVVPYDHVSDRKI